MQIDGRHINCGQRKDGGPKVFKQENIKGTLQYDKEAEKINN
jgi:hypothetical protein